jgi:3'(2'), 5'-bisphosphate nucleotidase
VVGEQPVGSVGLKAARIALGEADIYLSVSDRMKEWDVCAPEAILCAAGGTVSDCLGEPLRYNKQEPNTPRGILATNGPLHDTCLEALKPVVNERGWV